MFLTLFAIQNIFGLKLETPSLEVIEKDRANIFWNKITDDSKIAARYLVERFIDPTTKEATSKLIKEFTPLQLQTFLQSIQAYRQEINQVVLICEKGEPLFIQLPRTKEVTASKEIIIIADAKTIKMLDDNLIKLHAQAYLENLVKTARVNQKSAMELAFILSCPENFETEKIEKLKHAMGRDIIIKMAQNALRGFANFNALTCTQSDMFDPDPSYLINHAIGIQKAEQMNASGKKLLVYPDQLIYKLNGEKLKRILQNIDKETVIAIIKKPLSNNRITKFFDALPTAIKLESDVVIACAVGLLEAKEITEYTQMVALAFGFVLENQDDPRNKKICEVLEKLNIEKVKILLASIDKKENPHAYRDIFNKLSPVTQQTLRPINMTINVWEKIKVMLRRTSSQMPEELNKQPVNNPSKTRKFREHLNQAAKQPGKNPTSIPTSSIAPTITTLFSGLALTYSFFNWNNWNDIKNKKVFLPLAGAILAPFLIQKEERYECLKQAAAYGPVAGTLARFLTQSYQNGGIPTYAKKSYLDTGTDKTGSYIATAGAISAFLTGLFDLNFFATIATPIINLTAQTKPVPKTKPNNFWKNTQTISAATCYLTRTGISLISPAYTRLVETTEWAGRAVRSACKQSGIIKNQPSSCIT